MTQRRSESRRSFRAWLALVFAGLLCAPLSATPPLVAAAAIPPSATDPAVWDEARGTPADAQVRSIHYEQALEHAGHKPDFEPGDRVTVPFTPRAGDSWEVDGKAPKALPAGHATGAEMRAANASSIWAAGPPSDLVRPDHAGGLDDPLAGVDVDGGGAAASADPASANTGTTADGAADAAPIGANGLRREVFGFLPYWEMTDSSTVLDWRTLSTVAYFSVGCTSSGRLEKVDPDGTLTAGWAGWTSSKMTSIINTAHKNQTRVVLTISCFAWTSSGASRQASLLGSASARSTLAKAAAAAVRDRGADGINFDFEPIAAGYADEFTSLVRSTRRELNNVAPGYQLTFDTLGSIGNQPIADATAPGGADAVFIMGYDYRTASSSDAGSTSPLSGPHYDLTDTVKAYTARISPSKVILGVPWYGRAWSTSSDRLHASTLSSAKYGAVATPTYSQLTDLVAQHGRRYDSVEQSPWTAYRKQTCTSTYGCVTSWRELYYDDAASLRLRYDLVNRTQLRGAGIWALGYDGTRPELRAALADKFLADRTAPVTGVATLAQTQRDEGFKVSWSSWDDSAIAGYDVQVSVNGGAWIAWLTGTTRTSSIFLGENGRTYAFRVRAADAHGNVTAWLAAASAGTTGVPDAIAVGGFATVLTDGLRMREEPSTGAPIMVTLADGDALQVIGGPVTGEGYTWFQVSGPVKQWGPVDPLQVGGWVAVSGNGATNAAPRRPVYVTKVAAGIADLRLNGGGDRVLTPNGDGDHDRLHLTWTNTRSFDSLSLRIFRTDGTVAGTVGLGGTGSGTHAYDWDGKVGGVKVPAGNYVLQLQGIDSGATYSAPSAVPVTDAQIALTGVIVGEHAPTEVIAFQRPVSPNMARTLTWTLTFGGPIAGLRNVDFIRTGTATGCTIGTPVGSGAIWRVTLSGCSAGTVALALKPETVVDAVRNWGPQRQVNASSLLIDRSAPNAATPKVTLRSGVTLASTSTNAGLLATLTMAATDPGGAGVRDYDVRRSVDGGTWSSVGVDLTAATLNLSLSPGHSYRFSIRARDRAGNVGSWVAGPLIRAYLSQQTNTAITWKGGWTKVVDPRFSGGAVRYATAAGASARYAFTGRAIAWVTTFAPTRGAAKVYLDGVLVATVDTYAPTTTFCRVAFAKSWSSSGFHTIRIVNVGTVGHGRIDIDALEIVR